MNLCHSRAFHRTVSLCAGFGFGDTHTGLLYGSPAHFAETLGFATFFKDAQQGFPLVLGDLHPTTQALQGASTELHLREPL